VAVVRSAGHELEYLVLADVTVVLETALGRHASASGQVRALEDEDPGCVRWPRTKHRDDATAARWTLPLGKGTC
jgi:hypothetical protein